MKKNEIGVFFWGKNSLCPEVHKTKVVRSSSNGTSRTDVLTGAPHHRGWDEETTVIFGNNKYYMFLHHHCLTRIDVPRHDRLGIKNPHDYIGIFITCVILIYFFVCSRIEVIIFFIPFSSRE